MASGEALLSIDRPAGRARSPWWIVAGSVLGLVVGNGPMLQFTFGMFLTSLVAAFHSDRATLSAALMAGLCCTGLATPIVGRLIDRFGIRTVGIPAVLLCALSVASLGLFAGSATGFVLLYAVAGIVWAGQTPLTYARAVTGAFDARRGLALGIAMAGVGLGTALLPPLAAYLLGLLGWRGAYIALGLLMLVLAMPAVLMLGPNGAAVLGASPPAGLTAREAFATARFWTMATAFFCVALAASGMTAHMIPLLTDHGVPPGRAAIAIGVAGLALIGGRLVAGALLDRLFAPHVALAFFLLPLAGIALLLASVTMPLAIAAALLVGLGLGAEVDLIAYLQSRYFGLRAFGTIYGALFALFMLGSGIGPYLMGLSFMRTGNYTPALWLFVGALTLACLLVARLGPYAHAPFPERSLP